MSNQDDPMFFVSKTAVSFSQSTNRKEKTDNVAMRCSFCRHNVNALTFDADMFGTNR